MRERYAQTRHFANVTPPSFEDSVDGWIAPKCDNVLFESDKDVGAFLLVNGAL
jgi:hypothetical protein